MRADAATDTVELGALLHGRTRLSLPLAEAGTVAIFGNVVLGRAAPSDQARLAIHVQGARRPGRVVVGPLTVGGRYGRSFRCPDVGACEVGPLAPGTWRILFPEFDRVRSRFEVQVEPGQVARLAFSARAGDTIALVGSSLATLPAAPR